MNKNQGIVTQVIGPVVDVEFNDELPGILDALHITQEDGTLLVLETQQHLSGHTVRAIAMGATQGLKRGVPVIGTGSPISVPVGKEVLGRMLNVIGEPIDGKPAIKSTKLSSIHRDAPALTEQNTSTEILETGIKIGL